MKTPKVSVVATTFNHEKFIRAALDGFLMQRTDFDFDVVIADDCSSDKTPEILREYAKSYPKIIKPILRNKNIGVQENMKATLEASTGRYVALCEGDDYWTDPQKLQRQADYLENHPKCSLCFHPVKVVFESGGRPDSIYPKVQHGTVYDHSELLRGNFIQTNSVMYRRKNYQGLRTDLLPYDWYLHAFHAQFGEIGFIDRVMSVYRRHPGGLWWNQHRDSDMFWRNYGLTHLKLYSEFINLYGGEPKYEEIIAAKIGTVISAFADLDKKNSDKLLFRTISELPEVIELYAREVANIVQRAESRTNNLELSLKSIAMELSQARQEIDWMENSRFWKLRNILAKVLGRPKQVPGREDWKHSGKEQ